MDGVESLAAPRPAAGAAVGPPIDEAVPLGDDVQAPAASGAAAGASVGPAGDEAAEAGA